MSPICIVGAVHNLVHPQRTHKQQTICQDHYDIRQAEKDAHVQDGQWRFVAEAGCVFNLGGDKPSHHVVDGGGCCALSH